MCRLYPFSLFFFFLTLFLYIFIEANFGRSEESHLSAPLAGPFLGGVFWDSINELLKVHVESEYGKSWNVAVCIKHWIWAVPLPSRESAHFHDLLLGGLISLSHQEKCWNKKKIREGA